MTLPIYPHPGKEVPIKKADIEMTFVKMSYTGRIPRGVRVNKGDALHKGKDSHYRPFRGRGMNKTVDAIALETIGISRKNRWIDIEKVHPGDTFKTFLSSK